MEYKITPETKDYFDLVREFICLNESAYKMLISEYGEDNQVYSTILEDAFNAYKKALFRVINERIERGFCESLNNNVSQKAIKI